MTRKEGIKGRRCLTAITRDLSCKYFKLILSVGLNATRIRTCKIRKTRMGGQLYFTHGAGRQYPGVCDWSKGCRS
jgi:hypothetical protein